MDFEELSAVFRSVYGRTLVPIETAFTEFANLPAHRPLIGDRDKHTLHDAYKVLAVRDIYFPPEEDREDFRELIDQLKAWREPIPTPVPINPTLPTEDTNHEQLQSRGSDSPG